MTVRRFVVLVGDVSSADQNKVSEYLRGKYGWWHRTPFAWLVCSTDESVTVGSLSGGVLEVLPNADILVLAIQNGGNWSGNGRKDFFKWLRESSWASE